MNNPTFLNISIPPELPAKDELEKIVNDFPESAYARLLLMYQRKKNDGQSVRRLVEENFLYFKNSRWINFLLNDWSSEIKNNESGHYAISFPGAEEAEKSLSNELDDSNDKNINLVENFSEQEIQPDSHDTQLTATGEHGKYANNEKAQEVQQESIIEQSVSEQSPMDESALFEPLHTTDYFASQGIKISEEPVSDDKLGKQVKSFTEWLKSMKKIHPSKLTLQNEGIEQLVQTAAERSNIEAEIVTEAMADVLLRQGKIPKAIEIYEKLSLNNPTKSAYFAAKIEILKQQ